ncbi:MAG: tetratricopeptide repeat protein [Salinivirgaceae bacterium]|nr:tetratricopeptide repeat protein [Salinivirgaceae bacterium]
MMIASKIQKLLLILFFFTSSMGSSYCNVTDSLQTVYKTSSNDSAGFNALQRLFMIYRNKDIDSAKHYLALLYKHSDKNNHFRRARTLLLNGTLHHRQNKYDSAEIYYNNSLNEYQKINFIEGINNCYNNLGILYEEQGEYEKASSYLFKNLRIADSLGNVKEQSIVLTNIGLLFQRQEQFQEALTYYEKALALNKRIYNKRNQALLYNNMGIVYYYLEDYDKVLENFKRSLAIYREINDLRGQAMPFFNIGEIYFEAKNDYNKALYYYKKSLDIEQALGDIKGQATSLSKIGSCYMALNKFDLATQMQKEGIIRLRKIDAPVQLMTLYTDLSDTYEQQNNHKQALKYFRESRKLRDSLLNEKNLSQITKLKEGYESEKKDQEISRLNAEQTIQQLKLEKHIEEINNQNILLLILALFILVISLSGLFIYRIYRRRKDLNNILLVKNKIIEKKNDQLSVLFEENKKSAEIKEIFLANTTHELKTPLNVIQSFSNQLLTSSVNSSQRYYLEQIRNSSKNLLSLVNDILTLSKVKSGMMIANKSAFDLTETIRFLMDIYKEKAENKNIDFQININNNFPKSIITDQMRIAQICSNLIDNALKFTFSGGKVICSMNLVNNDQLVIMVEDTGIGMSAEEQIQIGKISHEGKNKLGLGINIVQSLTKLLNGTMQLQSVKNKGTTFIITLPIEIDHTVKSEVMVQAEEKEIFSNILIISENRIDTVVLMDAINMYSPSTIIDCSEEKEKSLTLLSKNSYDLVLLELDIYENPNCEILTHIRTHLDHSNAHIPVIAIANNNIEIEAAKEYGASFNGSILKPVEPSMVIEVLEEILSKNILTTNKTEEKLLVKIFQNDQDKIVEIIEHCQKLIPEELFKIEHDIKKGVYESTNKSISLIKSALIYIEDQEIDALIEALELHLKNEDAEKAKKKIEEIKTTWSNTEQKLLELVSISNPKV